MDRIERVQCVLEGRRPDRAPVSFWHHFAPDQVCGAAALRAHLDHVERYDLDFLKVMNDNGYPSARPIRGVADLASLTVLRGDEPEFARQLDLVSELKRALGGRRWMATTIFNAFATLRQQVGPPKRTHNPPKMSGGSDPATATILGFYRQDPDAVRTALENIGASLANFARRCLEAGADGVFLSVRDDWLDAPDDDSRLYDALVRPGDLAILEGASAGRFNLLHVCGTSVHFRRFAEYPVHAVNWADRAAGPSIRDVCGRIKPALCAGVDNLTTLPAGTPEDCEREVADALAQAGDRPILIGPGCTFDPRRVPPANLEAVRRAVER